MIVITSRLCEAYLKCPTKCFLRSLGETGSENPYANWIDPTADSTYEIWRVTGHWPTGAYVQCNGVGQEHNLRRFSSPPPMVNCVSHTARTLKTEARARLNYASERPGRRVATEADGLGLFALVEAVAVEWQSSMETVTSPAAFVENWDTPRNESRPRAALSIVHRGFVFDWAAPSTSRSPFPRDPKVFTF